MNKLFKNITLVLAVVLVGFNFASCDDDNGGGGVNNDDLYQDVLKNYVDGTIIPTYKSMAEAALVMRSVNNELKANPSNETMAAAAAAWMDARIWWELSEAFLFGPVSEDGFDIDGHIDSWPLELENIKAKITELNGNVTAEQAWNEDSGVIGFHTVEYLLFRDGQPRPIREVTEAERKYLTAVTDALVWDCVLAYVAWAGEDNVSSEIKAVFRENQDIVDHYNDRPNHQDFGKKMKTATGYYSSKEAAVQEIADGIITIAEEVGVTKIEAPYADQLIEEVESWYSWHSLDDYANNIYSIKNAYLGGINDDTRTNNSLSTFVASVNADLDKQAKAKIEECIEKIYAIGGGSVSFYEVVRDQTNQKEVNAATKACIELRNIFSQIKEYIN